MHSSHSQANQNIISTEDQVIYVEDLAGADDYWLSLTDAARVCRVQDVSIRRAINRKVLPVRRQRAGQNKRTRFVRASDLAPAGFPIIDESATITTEIGKVDVLSIPRQQQQIMQEQQALLKRMGEIQETLVGYQQQMDADLHQQQEHFQTSLQSAQEEQIRQLASVETRIVQEQEHLQFALTETSQRVANELQILRQNVLQEQADAHSRDGRLQTAIDILQTALLDQQKAVQGQFTDLVTMQQKHLLDYQQTVNTAIQRVEGESQAQLLALEQRMTDALKQLAQTIDEGIDDSLKGLTHIFDAQLTGLIKTLAQVQQSTENLHQSTTTRDQDLDHMLQQQQIRLNQHAQLLPLLPYVRQHLATDQDMAALSQALIDLETRLLATQQRELERYRPLLPLLDLLSPERLTILTHLLESE